MSTRQPLHQSRFVAQAGALRIHPKCGVPKWDELLKCKCDIDATPPPAPLTAPADGQTIPPAPLGDGRGEVPGGDLGAKGYAVELAAARRGPGRQPRMEPAETNAKTAERMRTVRGGILQNSVREMSCWQDI